MNLGQFYIIGLDGTSLSDFERNALRDNQFGGVILFSKNFENVEQLCSLVNEIQECRTEFPFFISVDQEGGRVQRFKNEFSTIPPMLELAKKDSPKLIFEIHKILGKELASCGINLNFSPVCDIFSNPDNTVIGDRALGKTSEEVEKLLVGAIRGLRVENVLSCAKHFPGHGDTLEDSHLELPRIKASLEELKIRELKPFKKAIRSKLEFMMMSHILNTCFADGLPCSLSRNAHDFLRNEMNYEKIIISDDMEMNAIKENYSVNESTSLAFEAGTDILIYRSLEVGMESLESLRSNFGNSLKSDIFKKKAERIYNCKGQFFPVFNRLNPSEVSTSFKNFNHKEQIKSLLN